MLRELASCSSDFYCIPTSPDFALVYLRTSGVLRVPVVPRGEEKGGEVG